MKIEDGKGKNGDASVSSVQRLNVSAKTAPRAMYAGRDFGQSYSAVYDSITAAPGDIVAYLKNTSSTQNLFVGDITAGGAAATKWKGWIVTGTAAAGETVVPTAMNLASSIPAEASAMAGDTTITGLTNVAQFTNFRHDVLSTWEEALEGTLILGPGDAISLETELGTGIVEVDIHFHFEVIGAN
jgi:hypothetical protein